jgi:predicted dehydrogenase
MSLTSESTASLVPEVPYLPRDPRDYHPAIGVIGCGGITRDHLKAYRNAGYRVAALCDIDEVRARSRRDEFYPGAEIYTDYRTMLRRDDIEVVDITTHPPQRPPIVEAALLARKHVLSQKPFVLDLDVGERLVELAAKQNVKLAVNQNGRWSPHWSYARHAVAQGLLGHVTGVHLSVHWSHAWVAGTPFEHVEHLIMYDFAIHWFDIVRCLMAGKEVQRVYGSVARSPTQTVMPPLLAQALIEFPDAQASLAFDADTNYGRQDRTYIAGSEGSIQSVGPSDKIQQLTFMTPHGNWQPALKGSWFPDGFHGTMGELLCSIEENRTPSIDAADNLKSLALCFAAVASAQRHQPVVPGSVRTLPGSE